MSHDEAKVALLRDAYDAFNREGVRGFERLLAPEVELLERPRDAQHRRLHREDALARLEAIGWQSRKLDPREFLVFGDRVVVTLEEVDSTRDTAEQVRAHYWRLGPAGANRLEVHRKRADAINASVGYFALLERLHERLRPRTYVEIGVHMGRSLGRVRPGTRSIGIDPEPKIADATVEESSKVFRTTSDDFFREHDLRSELGGLAVDLAFIDGMHLFEYALRDFMNIERYCSPQSVVLFHDCYPRERAHASRDWETAAWCGDVWKLIPCLREQRPELTVHAIDVRPAGMGMITGVAPESSILWDAYDEIEARYRALDYDWVEEGQAERLARLEHDWALIEALLPPPFQARADAAAEPVAADGEGH